MSARSRQPPKRGTLLQRGEKHLLPTSFDVERQDPAPPGGTKRWISELKTTWESARGRVDMGYVALVLIVVLLLLWTVFDVRADVHVKTFEQIPYPFNIVAAVRRNSRGLQWSNDPSGAVLASNPGYTEERPGTFRDVDTSHEDRKKPNRYGAFDEVFVLTHHRCAQQLELFTRRAARINLVYSTIDQYQQNTSLENPPLPLKIDKDVAKLSLRDKALLRSNLGYTMAHREAWRRTVESGRQRVLIIDDTLFLKDRLASTLPELFSRVDQESVAGALPWHFMYFRRMILEEDWTAQNESIWEGSEGTWSQNARSIRSVVRAKPSYGAGAYAVSLQGATWLHDHLVDYVAPLDLQISMLQKQYPREFVALSACNNDRPRTFCPENVEVLTSSSEMDECRWRRLQERRLSNQLN